MERTLTKKEAASMIDISAVRTHNTLAEIEEIVGYAKKYGFINVHVLPCWVRQLAEMLAPVEGVYVGAPVGFPGGAHKTETKLLEAKQLVQDGVEEMDIVMNVGKFKSGEYGYVLDELKRVVGCAPEGVLTKVIIELNSLTDAEIPKACELVEQSGANFLKTGTGWVPGGANIERIGEIKRLLGDRLKVKAAGGIRTRDEFLALLDLGVERFGINTKSALEIVESF